MAPTTDYQILEDPTYDGLMAQVKAEIKKGWQVYGGAFFAGHQLPYRRNEHFYQTMVKTEDLMAQMLTQLKNIAVSVNNIDIDADTLKSNTGTTASNTSSIKTSTANIDRKTPEP